MSFPEPDSKPSLDVSPTSLDFGIFNPELPLTEQPSIQLEITNTGGGILIGRVIPQYSWLIVSPVEFRIGPGQSSQHIVRLSTGAPRGQIKREFNYTCLIILSANGGTVSLRGSYLSTQPQQAPSIIPAWSWFLMSFLVLLIFVFILFKDMIAGWANGPPQPDGVSALYTQGAATVLAQLTTTTNRPKPPQTDTPEPPLFSSAKGIETPTSNLTPTYTPWPRTKYNVEQFISEYYATLNSQDYQHAWGMLSKNFQETCCKVGGNDPFVVYTGWWTVMNRVDVVSAYLQAWDKNPSIVYVSLHYIYKNGKTADLFQEFSLIVDAERNTLLIDQVK